ncbi:MAG: hypothetical protein ABWZ91_13415 [Nocardioides sp.]
MKLIRWAAVAVTALFVLMNIGAAVDPDLDTWVRVVGAGLALVGIPAAVGLALDRAWGRPAVIGAGALNMAGAVAAIIADLEGGAIGLVVGGLGVVLGALSAPTQPAKVATAA